MLLKYIKNTLPTAESHLFPTGNMYTFGNASLPWNRVSEILHEGGFPEGLRGEFAFIWSDGRETIAAVDHVCNYPLFYSEESISNVFHALSEKMPQAQVNRKVRFQVEFMGGHSIGEETTIQGIHRIRPGHFLKNGKQRPYIDFFQYDGDAFLDRERFSALVEGRIASLSTDKNALLLSGGTDSVTLAGVIKKLRLEPSFEFIHAYSDVQPQTETSVVSTIAAEMSINARHALVRFSGDILPEQSSRQFSFWIENPFPGKKLAVLESGCGSRRIFTGELGDQLFGGPKNDALCSYFFQTPAPSWEEVACIWINLSATYGRESGSSPSRRILQAMEEEPAAKEAYFELQAGLADLLRSMRSRDFVHRVMLLNYLTKGPYRTWAYSQDAGDWAHPFASWDLFDYSFRLRTDQKIGRHGVQKHLLLETWRPFVSDLPWRLPKHGFGIPSVSKIRTSARPLEH